jgi:hypothetical protein
VDYVLTKGINTNVQEVADQLDQQVQVLKQQEELKASTILQDFELLFANCLILFLMHQLYLITC